MVQLWVCKLKEILEIIPSIYLIKKKMHRGGDLTSPKVTNLQRCNFYLAWFLSQHTFSLELGTNSLGWKPTWGQINGAQCQPQSLIFKSILQIQLVTAHRPHSYTFSSFCILCIIQGVYPSIGHQVWWTQPNIFSPFRYLNWADRTLGRSAQRLLLSVTPGTQDRCKGTTWEGTPQFRVDVEKNVSHSTQLLFALFWIRHLLWICSWI